MEDGLTNFEEYIAAIIDSWRQGDGYVYEHLEGIRNDAKTILEKAKEELNHFYYFQLTDFLELIED